MYRKHIIVAWHVVKQHLKEQQNKSCKKDMYGNSWFKTNKDVEHITDISRLNTCIA